MQGGSWDVLVGGLVGGLCEAACDCQMSICEVSAHGEQYSVNCSVGGVRY